MPAVYVRTLTTTPPAAKRNISLSRQRPFESQTCFYEEAPPSSSLRVHHETENNDLDGGGGRLRPWRQLHDQQTSRGPEPRGRESPDSDSQEKAQHGRDDQGAGRVVRRETPRPRGGAENGH